MHVWRLHINHKSRRLQSGSQISYLEVHLKPDLGIFTQKYALWNSMGLSIVSCIKPAKGGTLLCV